MGMLKQVPRDYSDGRCKQAFKDETDINRILAKAQISGSISHLAKHEAVYGDFAQFDFAAAQNKIASANTIFAELPSEVRAEFGQSPQRFFEFANAPENVGKLANLLPKVAEPGSYFPNVRPTSERPNVEEVVEPVVPAEETPPAASAAPPVVGAADGEK